MSVAVSVPQTVEDLEKLLCEKLGVTVEQFQQVFGVEQKATDDFMIQQRKEWIDKETWISVNDVVREQKGTWDSVSKQWTIPYGMDSKVTYKESWNEIQAPTKETVEVNEEYANLLPPLPQKEYEALKQSIQKYGLQTAITRNKKGVILDGHNRFKICQELGITPQFEVKEFDEPFSEKIFVIEVNLRRRHLNDFQKVELSLPLLELEKERAKQRQEVTQLAGKTETGKPITKSNIGAVHLNLTEKGQARDVIAKRIGVSPTTYQRSITILQNAPDKMKEKVREGKTSISYAYKKTKPQQQSPTPKKLPEGQYNIIYADPPWGYNVNHLRGSPENYYPTMTLNEICNLKVPSSENAILFLWATNPMLEDALKVMASWGFKYKTNLVWVKNKMGVGFYLRGQHELLLIGVKGEVHPPEPSNRFSSVLKAPTRNHSQKPDETYSMIETMYPDAKYLELFARQKREGWEAWGNEV